MKAWSPGLLIIVIPLSLIGCDNALFIALFPPDDYLDPLVSIPIEPGSDTYTGTVTHLYKGTHSISLNFARANAVGTGYGLPELAIDCSFDYQGSVTQVPCGIEILPFWGKKSGISLATYEIPQVVPRKEDAVFRLEFKDVQLLKDLENQYGPLRLTIDKWSDL